MFLFSGNFLPFLYIFIATKENVANVHCMFDNLSLQNGGLLSSENQSCFDGCDWFKVCLTE